MVNDMNTALASTPTLAVTKGERVMDTDIKKFVEAVGATEPGPGDKIYSASRRLFRRSNYFLLNSRLTIVKISRSKKPFWGLGKNVVDFANELDDYFVVLLISSREGWVFGKTEVNANIKSRKWNLRQDDNQYKINSPLPDRNSFFSPRNFLKKMGLSDV